LVSWLHLADVKLQIRIVKNENEKNKKKPHRGYAFVVYEREKDMKGTTIPSSPDSLLFSGIA
jgi:hypothetical protein